MVWFDIVLVIGVGHGLLVTHDTSFGDTANEHAVGSEVNILFYFERHECVDVFVKEYKSVTGTVDFFDLQIYLQFCRTGNRPFKTENGASTDRQFTFRTPVCWITW